MLKFIRTNITQFKNGAMVNNQVEQYYDSETCSLTLFEYCKILKIIILNLYHWYWLQDNTITLYM